MKNTMNVTLKRILCLALVLISLAASCCAFAADDSDGGKRVYLAGPMFNHAEKDFNLKVTKVLEEAGYQVFLPQRDGIEAALLEGKTEEELVKMIFELDAGEVAKTEILLPTWIQSHDSFENEPPFEYPLNPLFSNRYRHRKRSEPLTFISCPEHFCYDSVLR